MKLGWPFRFNISVSFGVGGDVYAEPFNKPDARYALDTALMYEQSKVPSAAVAVDNAEAYLAYLKKHE